MRKRLILILSAALLLVSHIHLTVMLAPLEPGILAIQFAFTPQAYWRVMDLWGSSGVALYRAHFAFDNFHPLIYGAFGYLLITGTTLFEGQRLRRVAMLVLPLAGLFDLVENAAQLFLLAQPLGIDSTVIPLSATCSAVKWALVVFYVLLVSAQFIRKKRS